ncbi:MAG: hypothetical protein ABWY11_06005 [Umezawaea sp.]
MHNGIGGTVNGLSVQARDIGLVVYNAPFSAVRLHGSFVRAVWSCAVGTALFLAVRFLGIPDWRAGAMISVGTLCVVLANVRQKGPRWQTWGSFFLSLVCFSGSLFFVESPSLPDPAVVSPAVGAELLAYTTPAGVFLAVPGRTSVSRIERFDRGEVVRGLSWSSDGRYLAGTLHRSDKVTRVWSYDVQEGHSVEWPECSCSNAGFVGGQLLAVRGDDIAVFSFNFEGPRFLTPKEFSLSEANVLGVSADGMVFAVPDPSGTASYGGPEEVFVVKPDGEVTRLYGTSSNKAIMLSASRGDADYLAWKTGWRNGYCQDFEYVRAFRTANSSTYEIESLDPDSAWLVLSLRWSRSRVRPGSPWVLYSVQMSTKLDGEECREGDRQLLRSMPDGQWEQVPAPPGVVEGMASESGVLAVRTGRHVASEGDVSFIQDGVREHVAEGVVEMAWSR